MSRSGRSAVLELRRITKHYPGVLAVDDASLAFRSAEVVGLVGKNGAGKSTLIKIMAGAVKPDGGELVVDGQRVDFNSPHDATLSGLAFIHQELHDIPDLSVAENVMLGLGFPRSAGLFVGWERLRRQASDVLARLQVDIDPRTAVGDLSAARQRLVMIARGLAQQARVLVLDEPSASLNEEEIAHLFSVIRRLRDEDMGVVYVSHRLDEIFDVTDRVAVMRNGRVVADAPTTSFDRVGLITSITGHEHAESAIERRHHHGVTDPPTSTVLLDARNITTATGVRQCSFQVHAGEMVGLAGLMGSGRTELVRAVFGADRRLGGTIAIRGRTVPITSPESAMAAGLALLPEDRKAQGSIMDFSVRQNITLASLRRHRLTPRLPAPSTVAERAEAARLIERLAIRTPHDRQELRHLSGGNQQKVVIAKWLSYGADVFLFDEPTHGVDVDGKEEIYLIMEELAAQQKGVVFISSEFSELVGVCHRVLVMQEGTIVGELAGDEVTEPAIVELCYGARSSGAGSNSATAQPVTNRSPSRNNETS